MSYYTSYSVLEGGFGKNSNGSMQFPGGNNLHGHGTGSCHSEGPGRAPFHQLGERAMPTLTAWLFLHLLSSAFLLPVLILTFLLSKTIKKRHPTLINICVVWFLSGHFFLLLYYDGSANQPRPKPAVCTAQAALVNGVLPMWFTALLMLVLHVWWNLGERRTISRLKLVLILAAPYVAQIVFSLSALIALLDCPMKNGQRTCLQTANKCGRFFFCSIEPGGIAQATSIYTVIIGMSVIALESHLALALYKHWRGIVRSGRPTGIDGNLVSRVVIFAVYISVLGSIFVTAVMFDKQTVFLDMYYATRIVLFVVFGAQPDILKAWIFFYKHSPPGPDSVNDKQGELRRETTVGIVDAMIRARNGRRDSDPIPRERSPASATSDDGGRRAAAVDAEMQRRGYVDLSRDIGGKGGVYFYKGPWPLVESSPSTPRRPRRLPGDELPVDEIAPSGTRNETSGVSERSFLLSPMEFAASGFGDQGLKRPGSALLLGRGKSLNVV